MEGNNNKIKKRLHALGRAYGDVSDIQIDC